jgi:CheY-like chemotaxis protein
MKLFDKWLKKAPPPPPKPVEDPTFAGAQAANAVVVWPTLGLNRTILVVDDNLVVLKAFEMKLKTLGFRVLTAADGSDAVALVHQESPDLIVLDLNFPPDVYSYGLQWDGFTIMQWLQRFQEAATIPVIIITGDDPEKFKDKALAAGAVAFFQKPINQEEFLLAVRRALGQPKVDKTKPA